MSNCMILCNGKVVTMDPELPFAEAVVVIDDKINFVGSNEDAFNQFPNSKKIDLGGKTLVPGFIDSHCHLSLTGEVMSLPSACDYRSVDECLDGFRSEALKLDKGQALLVCGLDVDRLNRIPSLEELDKVLPDRPFLCRTAASHATLANSKALSLVQKEAKRLGAKLNPEDIKTGLLKDRGNLIAYALTATLMSDEQREIAKEKVVEQCTQAGVTTIHTLEGRQLENDPDVEHLLKVQDSLPFDTLIYYQTTNVDEAVKKGLTRIGGCILCLLDGDFSPGTAALREPYYNDPTNYGKLYFTDEELQSFFIEANRKGLQIAMHAIGDRAVDQALRAYEVALKDTPRTDHRHRIEHFEIPYKDLMDRMVDLGIVLAMQPAFDQYWDYDDYVTFLGPERARRKNCFRAVLDRGLIVGGGSDSFVTPFDPLLGIHACLNHSVSESRIGLSEALAMFTINSAYLGFEEETKGSIRPGKRADLAIISGDLYNTPADKIKDLTVVGTIYKGNFVWKDPAMPW
ncbi:MAG TPA: amidohydrolase [Firmicutes bacterium]|nr:amidohydrolase [Bacillota bacterium]